MSDTEHPYAEQIRALVAVLNEHRWLTAAETAAEDGTVASIRRYSFGCGADVHMTGEAVPGIGDHIGDFDMDGPLRRAFSAFKTQIDGVAVTTYATRR